MRPSAGPASPLDDVVWQGIGGWSRSFAVPVIGSIFAVGGVFIGGVSGRMLLEAGVIQPGTSSRMAPAVVGALGGGIAWFMGALACMIAFKGDWPLSRRETMTLVITAIGALGAGLLLAEAMPTFEDRWKDPRMFHLRRLIWLDAGLAAGTCLLVAQRRWKPSVTIGFMSVTGLVFTAVAVSQFLPFLAACAPIPGGGGCRAGY